MGKNLIQQARGKGGPRYRSPSFKFKGKVKFGRYTDKNINGKIADLIHCRGHSAPLAKIRYEDGQEVLLQAPDGVRVGETVVAGEKVEAKTGNIIPLKNVPEGTLIYNIESQPGDGGKFVRSSGGFAKVESKIGKDVTVLLPSNKKKSFNGNCRACIGAIAGSGRLEKPFLKAGKKYYAMKAKNKLWPSISGTSQNAVDHPFGGSSSSIKGRPTQSGKNDPPGRKVGKLSPRRTGRRKR